MASVPGFLGSHLSDRLLQESHEIIWFDILVTESVVNIPFLNRKLNKKIYLFLQMNKFQ